MGADQSMGGAGSTTTLAPLVMTLMAASTDPFLSLVLGFGTAYPLAGGGVLAPAVPLDFMVTARWEQGLDAKSAPADYAAVIAAPAAARVGALRPLAADGNWRSTLRIGWDRPPITPLFRTASLAATRASITPSAPTVALMEARPSGGYRPIAINQAADPPDPEFYHLNMVDRKSRCRPTPARANSPTRPPSRTSMGNGRRGFRSPRASRSPTSSRFGS
jgi:hypothetical protein